MRRHNPPDFFEAKFAILLAVVIIIILLLIIRPFDNKEKENQEDEVLKQYIKQEPGLENTTGESPERTAALENQGLCEEYLFGEGESVTIEEHVVRVDAIAKNSVKITANDKSYIITENEDILAPDNLDIELKKGKLLYFEVGSEHNSVALIIGCEAGEDPVDKYIREEARPYCETVYERCLDTFGID